ncbi:MAG: hypothetical protein ABFE08_01965 [Armatimonadia bacterium]
MAKLWRIPIRLFPVMFVLLLGGGQTFSQDQGAGSRPVFGCLNGATSVCLDLGSAQENAEIEIKDSSNQPRRLDEYFGPAETEGGFNFRRLKTKPALATARGQRKAASGRLRLCFPAIGQQDSRGFPTEDLLLEIRYKDVYQDDKSKEASVSRVFVDTKVAYGDKSNQLQDYLRVGRLLGQNDGEWKYEQIYLPKTDWQRLRAIGGKYTIQLSDERNAAGVADVPIDYVALHILKPEQARAFTDWQEQSLGAVRHDYRERNQLPPYQGDYTWFSVPAMKPIYPNQVPLADEIKRPIAIVSALSETEPFAFGIHAKSNLANLSFQVNDLKNAAGATLPAQSITVQQVIYADKYWARQRNAGEKSIRVYGLMPDYPKSFQTIDIPANSSQEFWGEINVGDNLPGGVYSGTISILRKGQKEGEIPLSLEVVPVKLQRAGHVDVFYHNPYVNRNSLPQYSYYGSGIVQDMTAHGIHCTIGDLASIVVGNRDGKCFVDTSAFEEQISKLKAQGLIDDKAFYLINPLPGKVIKACVADFENKNDWQRATDPQFVENFKAALRQIKAVGAKYGTEIVLSGPDEPSAHLDRRVMADRWHRLVREVGMRTWITYNDNADRKLRCPDCRPEDDGVLTTKVTTQEGKEILATYLAPLTDLVDFKFWAFARPIPFSDKPSFTETFGYYTTDYAQLRNPIYNRFLHSFYAERTQAKAVCNWGYAALLNADPYNDFDNNPKYQEDHQEQDYLLSYPAWDALPNPTFAIKGVREGVKDSKYLATLRALIAANRGSKDAAEAQRFINSFINGDRIKQDFVNDYAAKSGETGFHNLIVKYLSGGDENDYAVFDRFRKGLAERIAKLSH